MTTRTRDQQRSTRARGTVIDGGDVDALLGEESRLAHQHRAPPLVASTPLPVWQANSSAISNVEASAPSAPAAGAMSWTVGWPRVHARFRPARPIRCHP